MRYRPTSLPPSGPRRRARPRLGRAVAAHGYGPQPTSSARHRCCVRRHGPDGSSRATTLGSRRRPHRPSGRRRRGGLALCRAGDSPDHRGRGPADSVGCGHGATPCDRLGHDGHDRHNHRPNRSRGILVDDFGAGLGRSGRTASALDDHHDDDDRSATAAGNTTSAVAGGVTAADHNRVATGGAATCDHRRARRHRP